jgi:hypothetical protein
VKRATTTPAARDDLVVEPIGDHRLVLDPVVLRTHLLNPSASAVLELLDGDRTIDEVVDSCRDRFPDAPPDLASGVAAIVADLEGARLLGAIPRPATTSVDTPLPPRGSGPDVRDLHRTHRLRGIETGVVVAGDDPDLIRAIDELLGDLHDHRDDGDDGDRRPLRRYVIETEGERRALHLDGQLVTRVPRGRLVPHLLWHLDRVIDADATHHQLLHAGAVVADQGAVVLAGVQDSGKSTLTYALVAAGHAYVTDEVVAIRHDDLRVTPFPRPITLEAGSWDVFADTGVGRGLDTIDRRYRRPAPVATTRKPIALVVLPTYRPGAPLAIEPVDAPEAALELTRHTFSIDATGLGVLAELARTVPVVRLVHAGVDVAVPAVGELLADLDRRTAAGRRQMPM